MPDKIIKMDLPKPEINIQPVSVPTVDINTQPVEMDPKEKAAVTLERFKEKQRISLLENGNTYVANTLYDIQASQPKEKTMAQSFSAQQAVDEQLNKGTFGESLHTAMREVIPAFRELEDGRPLLTSFAFEDDPEYDINAPEVKKIFKEVGHEYYGDLREAKSLDELINTRDQILAAKHDIEYMENNHGFFGSMGLYALASVFDPASYVGYGLFSKAMKMSKAMSRMGTAQKAATVGGFSSVFEGSSEYYIQSHGARQYESVAMTALAAGVLAGGGTMFLTTMRDNHTAKRQQAFEALGSQQMTLKDNPVQAREHLETLYKEENWIAPYRSKIVEFFPTWMKDAFHSPSQKLYESGGLASKIGMLFDTPAGLSAEKGAIFGKDDNKIYLGSKRNNRTAQDVKEEMLEELTVLEYKRQQSYKNYKDMMDEVGEKPMTKEEYYTETHNVIVKEFEFYRSMKLEEINKIKSSQGLGGEIGGEMDEIVEKVAKDLETDEQYKALETEEERLEYRNKMVDGEVDLLAAQRVQENPDYYKFINEEYRFDVDANNEYYKNIKEHMIAAGVPFSKYYDPHMYQPVIYNKDAILRDPEGAVRAIEKAITEGAEYKEQLLAALEELKKATDSAAKTSKEQVIMQKQAENDFNLLAAKIEEIEKLEQNMKAIMEDYSLSPYSRAKELTRMIGFMEGLTDNSLTRAIKTVDGKIYVKQLGLDGKYRVYDAELGWVAEYIDVEQFDKLVKEGNFEQLSREEFAEHFNRKREPNVDLDQVRKTLAETDSVKELMTVTGTTLDDIVGAERGGFSSQEKELGLTNITSSDAQVVTHELLHNLTKELRANKEALENTFALQREIRSKREDILAALREEGVDTTQNVSKNIPESWEARFDYMTNETFDELYAVALSRPEFARALNKVKSDVVIKGKRVSLLNKLIRTLLDALGIEKLDNKSILGQIVKNVKSNATIKPKVGKVEMKLRGKFAELQYKTRRLEEELNEVSELAEKSTILHEQIMDEAARKHGGIEFKESMIDKEMKRAYEIRKSEAEHYEAELKKLSKKLDEQYALADEAAMELYAYHKNKKQEATDKLLAAKEKLKKEISELTDRRKKEVASAKTKVMNIQKNVHKRAKEAVKNISKSDMLTELGLSDGMSKETGSRMKRRKLNIDASIKEIQPYIVNNSQDLTHLYHYGVSGRTAVQHATGFQSTTEFKRYLEDNFGDKLKPEQVKWLEESHALMKGTKQIPSEENLKFHHAASAIKSANYISMGGQFATYGLSEIGAGVYGTGLRYLKELIPALGNMAKMYAGKKLDGHELDLIRLTDAGEIYMNNAANRFGQAVDITDNFNKAAKFGTKASRIMFRISGLEGITVLTKSALPNAFLERIISQAASPRVYYDLVRWGINPEDMVAIANQPVKRDKKTGRIVDFNFSKWDPEIADKFQLATSRMAMDTIIKPASMRIPVWLQSGESGFLVKLAGQFMSYGFMAHERLMLRGLSEERAMAITGMMISMGVLAAINMASEQVAISLGMLDKKDRKYDISTEDGLANLGKVVGFRNSFVGLPHFAAEIYNDLFAYNGGVRAAGKLGGVTVGRALNIREAAAQYLGDGKVGTAQQSHVLKTLFPYNNMVGIDMFTKHIAKDWYNESKERNFYQDTGYQGWNND